MRPRNKMRLSPALGFGDIVHRSLAAHYIPEPRRKGSVAKRGPHPAKTLKKIIAEEGDFLVKGEDEGEDASVSASTMGISLMERYIDMWGQDDHIRILSPEMPFQIPIVHNRRTIAIYVGTLDAVGYDMENECYIFLEHKTSGPEFNWNKLSMDEQNGSYWTYGVPWLRQKGIITDRYEFGYTLYNVIRKVMPDPRERNDAGECLNKNGSVSKRQPIPENKVFTRFKMVRSQESCRSLHHRTVNQVKRMEAIRTGSTPIKSIVDGCVGMQRCDYRDLCLMQEEGGNWEEVIRFELERWDPYMIHETSDETVAVMLAPPVKAD